ncbi:F-box/FBD/LRR protein [Rhynchospora pubera]|uniref:F-box/FBD/LRR protein n=1 Tax=Rhynchospora pubera TaxID=906938 RepID=A0AAV8HQR7_9POAL|nr:F-box/FBD/LRR protein [Rhynchospora pubera]
MSSCQEEEWNSPVPPDVSVGKPTEGLDNISRLPDCILTSILFLIPFKDSVRTSILSSHWRNLWKLTPLRLDDSKPASSLPGCPWDDSFSLNPYEWNKSPNLFPLTPNQLSFFGEYGEPPKSNPLDQPYNSRIARILSSTHDGPVHSLRLSGVKGFLFQHTVAHIVQTVIKRNICELTLDFRSKDIAYQYQPTLCLFSCNSLQKLTLTNCMVPKPTPLSISPDLKELNLMGCIRLDPDFLQTVLNSCASLQTMQLVSCEASSGPCIISVRSHSLRKFVLSDIWCLRLKELIIEDAPNLENLMLGREMIYSCDVKILHARKLRVLGFISTGFKKLQLGRDYFVQQSTNSTTTIDWKMMPSGLTLSTVKKLGIAIVYIRNYGRTLARLLGCFPCIESLYICDPNKHTIQAVRGFWNEQGSFEFLDYYLKEVIIKGFRGDKAEVEFLRFLVVNGKLLDKIILLDPHSTSTTIDSEEIQRKLCFHKRASKDLELVFSSETQCNDHVSLWKPLLDKEFISIP